MVASAQGIVVKLETDAVTQSQDLPCQGEILKKGWKLAKSNNTHSGKILTQNTTKPVRLPGAMSSCVGQVGLPGNLPAGK